MRNPKLEQDFILLYLWKVWYFFQISLAIHSLEFLYLAFHQKIPHQLGEFVF